MDKISFRVNDNYLLRLSYSLTLSTWWWYVIREAHTEIVVMSGELTDCKDPKVVPVSDARYQAFSRMHDLASDILSATEQV